MLFDHSWSISFSNFLIEGGIRVCGEAVLPDFWCGFARIFCFKLL